MDQVEASPYAADTAIFITEDEGGGYYDSGYVQPLDYFGDGTRIPLIVVAPQQYLRAHGQGALIFGERKLIPYPIRRQHLCWRIDGDYARDEARKNISTR